MESMKREMQILQENYKNLQTDRDLLDQEKKMCEEQLQEKSDRIADMEYQIKTMSTR